MIKAALIDLDGFLINSEELYLEANKIYFKGRINFTEEMHRDGTGKKFEEWIKTVYQSEKSGEEILKERNAIFFGLIKKKLKLLPGAENLLTILHEKLKTALVTSSKEDYVDLVFNLTGIERYFDCVITGESVNHGKPDPECYLVAARELKVLPKECVVFEDAPNGVLAGKSADMSVVAVPSQFVKGDSTFDKADWVFENLNAAILERARWLEAQD